MHCGKGFANRKDKLIYPKPVPYTENQPCRTPEHPTVPVGERSHERKHRTVMRALESFTEGAHSPLVCSESHLSWHFASE